jgi:hypothetical protein
MWFYAYEPAVIQRFNFFLFRPSLSVYVSPVDVTSPSGFDFLVFGLEPNRPAREERTRY